MWALTTAGMTVLPLRSTRVAPPGIWTSALRPACVKRSPSTTNTASSIGALPSPTMRRAPSNTVTSPPASGPAQPAIRTADKVSTADLATTIMCDSFLARRIGTSHRRWLFQTRDPNPYHALAVPARSRHDASCGSATTSPGRDPHRRRRHPSPRFWIRPSRSPRRRFTLAGPRALSAAWPCYPSFP